MTSSQTPFLFCFKFINICIFSGHEELKLFSLYNTILKDSDVRLNLRINLKEINNIHKKVYILDAWEKPAEILHLEVQGCDNLNGNMVH